MTEKRIIINVMLDRLIRIFNDIDPEGFEHGQVDGAPLTEYEMECRKLMVFMANNKKMLTPELLELEIQKIWKEYFDKECSKVDLLSRRILYEFNDTRD